MAKEQKPARVRVFFGEIEGDNDTIRDGLRSIAAAVNKTFQPSNTIIKVISSQPDIDDDSLLQHIEQQATSEEEGTLEESSNSVPDKASRRTSQRAKKSANYSLVKDLNLRPANKQSFREFWEEKRPGDKQPQQVAVVVHYLEKVLEVQAITVNHIYTALKEVGARVPGDLRQTLYNTSSRNGWIETSDIDSIKITVHGENLVEHDLPSVKTPIAEGV